MIRQHRLLALVREVIDQGCHQGQRCASTDATAWSATERGPGASFVTLTINRQLRGCCGSLHPVRSLVEDLAENAWRTAFADPRFPPVASAELPRLHLDISLLSALEPVPATDPEGLMAAVEPGVHGLLIACGERRATFLPKVWDQLPDAGDFLRHLKHKARLPIAGHGPLKAWRYTATCFGGAFADGTWDEGAERSLTAP